MAVYYKFKSARDFDSLPIDGHFISVGNLKERIFESKHLGRGKDFDLMVSNAQTNEEYADEATLIPRNTSVLIRRIPGCPRKPIVTQPDEPKLVESKIEETQLDSGAVDLDSSAMKFPESEWDEFGNDLYAIPEVASVQSSNPIANFPPPTIADEDSKIKALVDTPALDWQQAQDNYGPGRGYGRGMGGRSMGGRGFGRVGPGGFERKTPPPGYICHRCKVPGHFIQHCPTNGDPNYDIRRVKPPTGIPKSMLVATNDGSYALSSGVVAVMRPNEAAFEKEIDGLPSTRSVTDFPPELHCPLCKEVMKDAVLTSKCCFSSFCDKCIRDHIISKSICTCGATHVLADDLLPNKTLRDTINRIMESTSTSSADNAGSFLQAPDMESTRPLPPRVPSPTLSATKGESILPPFDSPFNKNEDLNENEGKEFVVTTQSEDRVVRGTSFSKATSESLRAKQPTSQESAPAPTTAPVEESQEKPVSSEPGKKKKKKKTRLPIGVSDMQWQPYQEMGAESCGGMPFMPPAFNPYVNSMPWGMDGYMAPFPATMPMMGFHQGPFDSPFGGVLPHDPFAVQGYMMPPFPQRDLAEMTMGGFNMNSVPPMMNKEFEARKANLRKRNEIGKQSEREHSKDGGSYRGMSYSTENAPPRPKPVSEFDRPRRVKSPERRASSSRDISRCRHTSTPPPLEKDVKPRSKREEPRPASDAKLDDKKYKASVFSRISFPSSEEEEKKRRKSKATPSESPSNGLVLKDSREAVKSDRRLGKGSSSVDYDSSEECHFKRRKASSPSERHEHAREHDREGRSSKRRR